MVLQSILKLFVGDKHGRERKRLWPIVEEINALAADLEALSDDELKSKTGEFRRRLAEGETLDDCYPRPTRWSRMPAAAISAAPGR